MGKALPPDAVRRLFDYVDGILFWRERPVADFRNQRSCSTWNAKFAGQPAGHIHKVRSGERRRIAITHDGAAHRVYASRLIWAWHHGVWPSELVDHEDGDTLNDLIGNLRDVPDGTNSKNMKMHCGNKSGVTGVCQYGRRGKWKAEIMADGVKTHLGVFDTIDDAAAARKSAERALGFHVNHGRSAGV